MTPRLLITLLALLLAACDIPGMGPDPRIALREAEGKAIGGACRQAMRGIEDCYTLNEKSSKTAVYTGWKEMDEYMRENKLEGQQPVYGKNNLPETAAPAGAKAEKEEVIIDDKKPVAADPKARPGNKPAAKH